MTRKLTLENFYLRVGYVLQHIIGRNSQKAARSLYYDQYLENLTFEKIHQRMLANCRRWKRMKILKNRFVVMKGIHRSSELTFENCHAHEFS